MEINYQFRQRYSVIHTPCRWDKSVEKKQNEIEIGADWLVVVPCDADAVLMNAARDLVDYFFVSMGLSLRLIRSDEYKSGACICYEVDPKVAKRSYRLLVTEDKVIFVGHNSRMAAQAGYFIEDLMNLREAPFLERTDVVRTSLFSPRMVHSGYGLDMYPNEHLINIAHSGVDAILAFVKDIDITPHGYHDFNALCYRAAQYGIDVYAYSYLHNKLHPEEAGAEEYYEKLYGHLLDRCPYFKGIIFVGESCEFPSKDPHTEMVRRKDNYDENGKPIPNTKPYPGWWPCYDYPIWLDMVSRIMRRRRPDLDIVFWSYNWCRVDASYRKALIDTLPKDITLQATFEMGEFVVRDGIKNTTADYTLYHVGPGNYFKTEGQYAKENGLKFYSMTNTGGLTWDVGVVPYIPAPYRWIERYRGMLKAHEEYGLCGTMDCHHYGFSPSFVSDLAKWAFWSPECDLEEALGKIAARDFSAECRDMVLRAYRHFSDAMYHLISVVVDQYGPFRIGPAYPLILFENTDVEIPTLPYAHFKKICYPVYGQNAYGKPILSLDSDEAKEKFDYEIANFKRCAELFGQGIELLYPLLERIPERKRDNARRIVGLCHFIRNTALTAVHTKEFYKRKVRLLSLHGEERNSLIDEMLDICAKERENALDTVPLVDFDSRLGYEPSMEYMCDKAHIEWKLSLLDGVTEKELPSLKE
ncbi:MAG: hypothetical protein E7653_04680 [Ruminococcaceae bacterium]|nr:hypothetical protein [Oscillospiraceae bacterium]